MPYFYNIIFDECYKFCLAGYYVKMIKLLLYKGCTQMHCAGYTRIIYYKLEQNIFVSLKNSCIQ